MSSAFIPFAALASVAQPGAASAGSAPAGRPPFVPLPVTTPAPAAEAGPAPAPAAHKPVVKLHREGDVVKRIQIHCSCGQVIELDCVY